MEQSKTSQTAVISERIEKLRNDTDFLERLQRAVERNKEALRLLSR